MPKCHNFYIILTSKLQMYILSLHGYFQLI